MAGCCFEWSVAGAEIRQNDRLSKSQIPSTSERVSCLYFFRFAVAMATSLNFRSQSIEDLEDILRSFARLFK